MSKRTERDEMTIQRAEAMYDESLMKLLFAGLTAVKLEGRYGENDEFTEEFHELKDPALEIIDFWRFMQRKHSVRFTLALRQLDNTETSTQDARLVIKNNAPATYEVAIGRLRQLNIFLQASLMTNLDGTYPVIDAFAKNYRVDGVNSPMKWAGSILKSDSSEYENAELETNFSLNVYTRPLDQSYPIKDNMQFRFQRDFVTVICRPSKLWKPLKDFCLVTCPSFCTFDKTRPEIYRRRLHMNHDEAEFVVRRALTSNHVEALVRQGILPVRVLDPLKQFLSAPVKMIDNPVPLSFPFGSKLVPPEAPRKPDMVDDESDNETDDGEPSVVKKKR